jgi:phosphotransferase system enzyme I (PtsI)
MAPPLDEPSTDRFEGDPKTEAARVHAAQQRLGTDLTERASRVEGDSAHVLTALAQLAVDPAIMASVTAKVTGGKTGERAVFEAFSEFATTLTGLGGYFAERAGDLGDLAQRIIADLRGVSAPGLPHSDTPYVLVARDLAPADTAVIDYSLVKALVTSGGGPTSHTAILARSAGLPAVVATAGALDIEDGTEVLVDASTGTVTLSPSADEKEASDLKQRARAAASHSRAPGSLADGTHIQLLANIGGRGQAAEAADLGAEGIGLFRSEFLFLGDSEMPSIETQRDAYLHELAAFPGKKVVVRVLDAGSDKPLAYLTDDAEENPALGSRGLRALRDHPEVLDAQLEALVQAQAATDADLWVMAPMVADAEEAEYFVSRARAAGLTTVGVMAEIPAVAMLAEQVVQACDFISIGTNDLTQYTMAADRLLGTVATYQSPWHPAVLRLIERLGSASAAAHTPLGVCGEAAADPELAIVLVGLGVTSLSMSASAFADVRASLLTVTMDQAKAKAAAALAARGAAQAQEAARAALEPCL